LVMLGVCSLEKTPGQFVATHRAHHQHEDEEDDPHSPLVTIFWGHMGWLLVENRQLYSVATYEKYARDVFRDPFYLRLEQNFRWLWLYGIHAVLFYVVGFVIGVVQSHGSFVAGLQFGLSLLVWGAFLRTVLVWHITWSVNSFGHVSGYRTYETRGNSRNNWWVGVLSNGDGWHNNHHADQRAASHGHKWWELDVTYATLVGLRSCGLVWDLVPIAVNADSTVADIGRTSQAAPYPSSKAA
jgi:fatty-acid desaturase